MYDLVLQGGSVLDGLGGPAIEADVAIAGGRVAEIGPALGPAVRVIDVAGLTVAPGFIDPHSHSDAVPFMAEPQPFKLVQGVTTEITGNCGFSLAPLDEAAAEEAQKFLVEITGGLSIPARDFAGYLDDAERAGPTNHIAPMVGHNTLRMSVAGMRERLPDGGLARMCELLEQALRAGAVGFSSGLIYPPGCYGDTEELVALAKVAAAFGRPYTTHMRNEDRHLAEALDEAITIAGRSGAGLQVSHCKAAGRTSHGGSRMLLSKLYAAREAGIDVYGDAYPYLAGGTFLSALLPAQAHAGGMEELRARLGDPARRAALRAVAEDAGADGGGLWSEVEPADVLVGGHTTRPAAIGRTLAELAAASGEDPWEAVCDLIAADPGASMVIRLMAEDDVRRILADPLISIGSDNGPPAGRQHPRTWGCFPVFLGRYVREVGVVDLPEAIRKLTSMPADRFGLTDRGRLRAGAAADVTVFDPDTIGHPGDYATPDLPPTGIQYVLLEGRVAIDDGEFTGVRAGRVLRA